MSTLTLVFCKDGTAMLQEEDEPVWASDDDEDFPTEIGAPDALDIEDSTRILTYLVESDIITEAESQLCSIESEEGPEIIDAQFEEVANPS